MSVVIIIQGGGVAAPIGAQVLGEVLPYLEVQKENEKEEDKKKEVEVPNLIGLTVEEAKKTLKDLGLSLEVNVEEEGNINEKETIIKEQLPVKGIKIYEEGKVSVEIE